MPAINDSAITPYRGTHKLACRGGGHTTTLECKRLRNARSHGRREAVRARHAARGSRPWSRSSGAGADEDAGSSSRWPREPRPAPSEACVGCGLEATRYKAGRPLCDSDSCLSRTPGTRDRGTRNQERQH